MRNNIVSLAVGAVFFASSAAAVAYDGTVKFEGEIRDVGCVVDIGPDNTMVVNMGIVAKSTFTGAGSLSDPTKFTLKLKDCPESITSGTVKFDGTAYSGDDEVLKLTEETGVATGVGIQLSDSTHKVLPLYTASSSYTLEPTVENKLDFYARYIAKENTVNAGKANSVATFTVNYN